MKAADVMTGNVVTITRGAGILEAIRLMLAHRISGLPVVDATGRVEGILTEGDLLRRSEIATERRRHWPWLEFLLGPGHAASEYVRTHGRVCDDLMSRDVISVAPEASLANIVELMERRHIKRVPVIANNVLLGIVSRPDLLAAIARVLDQPQAAGEGDEGIRERLLADLAGLDWAPRSGLTITVTDGIVQFDGVVLDEHERTALRVAAENVPGVKAIVDRLVWVEPVSGTVIEAAGENPATESPSVR
jgi:CBS domain-containing protein